MNTAFVFGRKEHEFVSINETEYQVTTYTYADYVRLFSVTGVTHVMSTLGLEATQEVGDAAHLGDGMHVVDDFLGAIAMYEAACGTQLQMCC
jgi:hypothetical protein